MWAIIIILFFFAAIFYITYRAQQAGVKTGVEYLLAGRSLGWIATFAGLYMTMMSAYTFMGMPGLAYRVGVGAWLLGLVTCSQAGTILFIYPKLRALGQRFNFMTQADYLCDRFTNAKSFRLFIALVGIVAMIVGHFLIQLIGSGLAMQQVTGFQVPYMVGVVFFVVMTTAYVFLGGFRATAWTDIFMGIFFLVSILFIVIFTLSKLGMNLPEVYRTLAAKQPDMMSLPGKLPFFPYPQVVSWVLGYTFAFMLMPHMVMRAYSAASDKALRITALGWTTIGCLAHFLTACVLGFAAAVLYPTGLPKGVAFDAVTPHMVYVLSPAADIVGPILMMGVFCAALSTAGGALLTMSTIITKDFLVETFNMNLGVQKMRNVSRVVVVLVGASAIALAYAPKEMIAVIFTASIGLVSIFPIPYVLGLFWKRFNAPGAVTGMIVGLIVIIWLTYIPVLGGGAGQKGVSILKFQPLFWSIAVQLVVSVIVALFTPPPSKAIIERHFPEA